MKAIVGVDVDGHYLSAMNLLARLGFDQPTVELVHVDDVFAEVGVAVTAVASAEERISKPEHQDRCKCILNAAKLEACARGVDARCIYCMGNDCERLIDRADEEHADLIVIGASKKAKYGPLFLGSVGRGLTIAAHRSLLVAKKETSANGNLKVVFATDGSDYARDCLRSFIRLHPQGIKKIIVVSAIDPDHGTRSSSHIRLHVNSLVIYLCEEGFEASGRVIEGAVADVLDEQMEANDADLLIVGAQGHGELERQVVGSTSLQAVLGTPHSILMLRNPA